MKLCVISRTWIRAVLLSNRKDPHGFFAFPVTDAIAPGYSMIIKHPMDFSTMKDKIAANEYKTITEFKVLQCSAYKRCAFRIIVLNIFIL